VRAVRIAAARQVPIANAIANRLNRGIYLSSSNQSLKVSITFHLRPQ